MFTESSLRASTAAALLMSAAVSSPHPELVIVAYSTPSLRRRGIGVRFRDRPTDRTSGRAGSVGVNSLPGDPRRRVASQPHVSTPTRRARPPARWLASIISFRDICHRTSVAKSSDVMEDCARRWKRDTYMGVEEVRIPHRERKGKRSAPKGRVGTINKVPIRRLGD